MVVGGGLALANTISETLPAVKANINISLIIGGGLKIHDKIHSTCIARSDIIRVGNVLKRKVIKY